jgi:acetoin utilization protein AcuB
MIAGNLISDALIPLRTSDTGEEALSVMNDFYVRHLPIVNNEQLLGLISEDDILNHNILEPVGSYGLSINFPPLTESDHIYEAMRIMADYNLTVIPVVDLDGNYTGMVTEEDLLHYFAKMGAFTEPGGILVLEMHRRDYSLTEIARIIESENSAILSSFVSSSMDTSLIHVTLKLNSYSLQNIIATFERFDYVVKASFSERDLSEALKERYQSFMHYLNV